jgi:hypothetical protein
MKNFKTIFCIIALFAAALIFGSSNPPNTPAAAVTLSHKVLKTTAPVVGAEKAALKLNLVEYAKAVDQEPSMLQRWDFKTETAVFPDAVKTRFEKPPSVLRI